MNIILGFGSTEKEQQENVYKEIYDIVESKHLKRFGKDSYNFFHDDDITEIKKELNILQKRIESEYNEIEEKPISERAERYFKVTFSISIVNNNCFIGADFWHINSRHPMSPDGIALLQEKKSYWIESSDICCSRTFI